MQKQHAVPTAGHKVNTVRPVRVFYSWQSDLPKNKTRHAIKNALDDANKSLGNILHVDEATRDEAGSPNIPQTILEKIGKADIFVADISTINSTQEGVRRCPNPNVVFELGYAVTILGWSRIVLLFNSAFGDFPSDLPFDFDRHRASPFSMLDAKNSESQKKLKELVKVAINSIIMRNPKRPSELAGLTEEQVQKTRDTRMLEWVLRNMHFPTIDEQIERLPHSFPYRSLHFFEGVRSIVQTNSLFYISDTKLESSLKRFVNAWAKTVQHDNLYHLDNSGTLVIFTNPGDMPLSREKEAIWQEIEAARLRMKKELVYILKRVRKDYFSINLMETNAEAWADYRKHQLE